jgi:hypothetical protein
MEHTTETIEWKSPSCRERCAKQTLRTTDDENPAVGQFWTSRPSGAKEDAEKVRSRSEFGKEGMAGAKARLIVLTLLARDPAQRAPRTPSRVLVTKPLGTEFFSGLKAAAPSEKTG